MHNATDAAPADGKGDAETHQRIAQAVAQILRPTIVDAVEEAVRKSLQSIQVTLERQTQRLTETEQRISSVEDEVLEVQAQGLQTETTMKTLMDKLDDLENRARRNSLRIIGIPESYNAADLMRLCTKAIPGALGIHRTTPVERAHRLGPIYPDRKTPRAVIAA